METRARSIAKSLSWRVVATFITTLVAYAITGEADFAAKIGLFDTSVKFLAYFAHERMWVRISYGRREGSDYQI